MTQKVSKLLATDNSLNWTILRIALGLVMLAHGVQKAFGWFGSFGWDGAFGTSWFVDPNEQLVGILMIQRCPDTLNIPLITRDFWTSVYQLIED